MPGGRGGRRQGTPGKGYNNRTDLALDYAPPTPAATPASGGAGVTPAGPPTIYPEDIPKLNDPTGRPNEPVTTMLSGGTPTSDPTLDTLRAAYAANPTPEMAHVIRLMSIRKGTR